MFGLSCGDVTVCSKTVSAAGYVTVCSKTVSAAGNVTVCSKTVSAEGEVTVCSSCGDVTVFALKLCELRGCNCLL